MKAISTKSAKKNPTHDARKPFQEAPSTHGVHFIDNRSETTQLMMLQDKANNYQGNSIQLSDIGDDPSKPIQMAKPGDAVPSLHGQLTTRLGQMGQEAGINQDKIMDVFIQILHGALPPLPVLGHPLANAGNEDGHDLALEAIHMQLREDNSQIADLNSFKGFAAIHKSNTAAHYNLMADYMRELDTILDPIYNTAKRNAYTDAQHNPDPELRAKVQQGAPGDNLLANAATAYLAPARGNIQELNPLQRARFIQHLKNLPVVKSMLEGSLAKRGSTANLLRGMDTAGHAQISQALVSRIENAMKVLGGLVQNHVLPPNAKVPHIEVNPPSAPGKKFRANANRTNNKVRIAELEEIDIIVHEFGHQIEFNLPIDEWHDIQQLLRMRHKGGALVSIYPRAKDQKTREEASLNADMPATGQYSAKVYDDGSTEVMSMTLEYFSTPAKAKVMIEQDPLQAAIILRIIQPEEYHNLIPKDLQALLPRGDIRPGQQPIAPPAPSSNQKVSDAIGNDAL